MTSTVAPGAQAGEPAPPTPRLEVAGLSMTFGSTRVLREVALSVAPGEIHALVGQNGSGKSTLAKVLTGLYRPDRGTTVQVDGEPLRLPVRPGEARGRGVAVVHQNLGLLEDRTVLDNMRIGRLRGSGPLRRIRWDRERAQAEAVFAQMGRRVPLDALARTLPEEDRATVAIARALQDATPGRGLIIFDESTRALGRASLQHFYDVLDEIVATGTAVLLITHRLEEVVSGADRVTVLRDGRIVESARPVEGLTEAALTALILGRTLGERETRSAVVSGADELVVRGLTGGRVTDLDLTVRRGEVLGLTGLAGSGHEDVPYLLAGVAPVRSGSLTVAGRDLALPGLNPARAIEAGVALVPEGRELFGVAGGMTVAENIAFPHSVASSPAVAPLPRAAERELVAEWIGRLDIVPPRPRALVSQLSGGNQQKVSVSKWLSLQPAVLLLHEPTQAVDIGARLTIAEAVREAAAHGTFVIVASTDENELALFCDRVLVLEDGVVRTGIDHAITPDGIVEAIYTTSTRGELRRRA